jgi:hypothetical protein
MVGESGEPEPPIALDLNSTILGGSPVTAVRYAARNMRLL